MTSKLVFLPVKYFFVYGKYEELISRRSYFSHFSQIKFCFTDTLKKFKFFYLDTISTKTVIEIVLLFDDS